MHMVIFAKKNALISRKKKTYKEAYTYAERMARKPSSDILTMTVLDELARVVAFWSFTDVKELRGKHE